jgi:hypothetical protein
MYLIRSTLFIVLFINVSETCISQIYRPNAWKRYRKEVVLQVGASGFLGDLGGRNSVGTDYSPLDLEANATRLALSLAYRYKFTKKINLHTSFNYLTLSGDDKLTADKFRNNRNLNFKTNLYEIGTRIEFSTATIRQQGIYNIRRNLGKTNRRRYYEVMGFVGIAGFYFNPKGKNPADDSYINLYNLHTEGQGLPNGPKQYKRIGIAIPVGVAFRAVINKEWTVGLEFNYRMTFTDYIDDVSTTYYDRVALTQAYGKESAIMSDPNLGAIDGATAPDGQGNRAQRGDKNKDSYMSLQFTVGRIIKSKRSGRTRIRSKF